MLNLKETYVVIRVGVKVGRGIGRRVESDVCAEVGGGYGEGVVL